MQFQFMNNYIAVGEDKFSIDPTAKNVVGADIYAHYEKGSTTSMTQLAKVILL